jgi:predicted nucleic acid-binding Zn ribbon protein
MTYLYETIPSHEGEEVKRYEIQQSMHDPALTVHPETGEPIRRVILGGWGLITGKSPAPTSGGGKCTPGGGCC